MNEFEIMGPAKGFEEIKKIGSKSGIEFWHARELMYLLGYDRGNWREK